MLELFDYIYPRDSEISKLIKEYQKSPTNKTAKTQAKALLRIMSDSEVEFSAHDAPALLKNLEARLIKFTREVKQDVDVILKASQPSPVPGKRTKPSEPKSIKIMPEAAATLEIFNKVAAASSSEERIILFTKKFDPYTKSNFRYEVAANFQNYKKLFNALVNEMGYEIKEKNNRERS